MSRIAKIIQEPEHVVAKFLADIENKNGSPRHDARLLAEIIQKVRVKIAELGLDPDDTSGEELYQALLVKFEKSAKLFDLYFGAEDLDFDGKVSKAISILQSKSGEPRRWALKNTAAKDILRRKPPKRLMKKLGYRSVDSMLKHENISELFLTSKYIESASWQKEKDRLVSGRSQTDFEPRQLRICGLNYDTWSDISGPDDYVVADYDVAAIGLWPSDQLDKAPLLSITLLLDRALNGEEHSRASDKLPARSGILEWWADMDHLVAELAGEHVSLNIEDSLINNLAGNSYQEREVGRGRNGFWRELLSRYQHLPPTEALFDHSVRENVARLKLAGPQPAYEFAEEFDG